MNAVSIPKMIALKLNVEMSSMFNSKMGYKRYVEKIMGAERRKENFALSTLFNPLKIPVDIVSPERESPGRMASP